MNKIADKNRTSIINRQNIKKPKNMTVYTNNDIIKMLEETHITQARDCYKTIKDKLLNSDERLIALTGLRRTGKTILLLQLAASLVKSKNNAAFVECYKDITMTDVTNVINSLIDKGFLYIFIDEITYASDFMSCCNIIADTYTLRCKKIVLTGTESLKLVEASKNILYNRITNIDVNYISFREYNRLLGKNLEAYLKTGGTLVNVFDNYDSTHNYINTSISANITNTINSIRELGYSTVSKLYNNDEIYRIIESNANASIYGLFNKSARLETLVDLYEKHTGKQITQKTQKYLSQIFEQYREYLTAYHKKFSMIDEKDTEKLCEYLEEISVLFRYRDYSGMEHMFLQQTGLMYQLVVYLLEFIHLNTLLLDIDGETEDMLCEILKCDTIGILLENVIFLNIYKKTAGQGIQVTKYRDSEGREIDVLVINKQTKSIDLYEVKNSSEIAVESQAKHLLNENLINSISKRNNCRSVTRTVIYMGMNKRVNINDKVCIDYINAAKFLMDL